MVDIVRARGTLPFPEAGEGVVLRFTTSDCEQLQIKFKEKWFQAIVDAVDSQDMATIKFCLEKAAKKDGKPHKIDLDQIDLNQMALGRAVVDTLYLAMFGRTVEEHLNFLTERAAELAVRAQDEPEGNQSSPESSSLS